MQKIKVIPLFLALILAFGFPTITSAKVKYFCVTNYRKSSIQVCKPVKPLIIKSFSA